MLVIHPEDKTTTVLSLLYEGEDIQRLTQSQSGHDLEHAFHHCSQYERILLLGHGSDKGLFSREDDTKDEFDRILVGHPHAYHLRRHGSNLIGIWCHADLFARKEGLHGLFSGMIISDKAEAEEYGFITLQQHIDEVNEVMFAKLRKLLDEGTALCDIPRFMQEANDSPGWIAQFNYNQFYYL